MSGTTGQPAQGTQQGWGLQDQSSSGEPGREGGASVTAGTLWHMFAHTDLTNPVRLGWAAFVFSVCLLSGPCDPR